VNLRVGLVGLGDVWHQRHAPALRALADRFEVRAICDQVGHRAEQAARQFSAVAVDGYRALAGREDLEAVLILSPQWFGALPILAACESGKAVYCATGLQLEPDEAQRVKRCVEESGVTFAAEFPRRLAPAALRLQELIATSLGVPRLLFCHQRLETENDSLRASSSRQGCLSGDFVELVDWCCYVVDCEPSSVIGLMHQCDDGSGREDYQMMSLDFSERGSFGTGPIAQISCGRYIPGKWEEAISYRPLAALQVSCRRGVAFVDLPSTLVWFDEAGRHQELLEAERPVGEQLLRRFHLAVTGSVGRTRDLEDAYRALWIVQQARVSHLEGRRIEL